IRDFHVTGVQTCALPIYKNVSDEGLYAYVTEVIKRVGDKRLALYLYNFPQMTTIRWSPALVGLLLQDFPETIVGLKDSSGDEDRSEERRVGKECRIGRGR